MKLPISQETIDQRWWRSLMEPVVAEILGIDRAYVVFDSELPNPELDRPYWGCVSPDLAQHLRAEIGDRWVGPRPAMIVSVAAITNHVRGMHHTPSEAAEIAIEMCNGVVAHEATHLVEYQLAQSTAESQDVHVLELRRCFDNWGEWEISRDEFLSSLASPSVSIERSRIEHGQQFCRLCLHVLHRLNAHGIDACQVTAIDFQQFGLPRPAYAMRTALSEELVALANQPLIQIASKNPPEAFGRLFEASNDGDV